MNNKTFGYTTILHLVSAIYVTVCTTLYCTGRLSNMGKISFAILALSWLGAIVVKIISGRILKRKEKETHISEEKNDLNKGESDV